MPLETKHGRPLTREELYELLIAEKPSDDWLETEGLIRAANGGQLPDFWEEIVDKVNLEKRLLRAVAVIESRPQGKDYLAPKSPGRAQLIRFLKGDRSILTESDAYIRRLDRKQLIELFTRCGHPLQDNEK